MTDYTHEPTPEFTRFLEWQVTSALRRRDRFARPAFVTAGPRRHLATAAIAIVSLMAGAGVVTASARIQGNSEKQLLVQQQQAEIQLTEMQLALAKKTADEAQRRATLGLSDKSDAVELQRKLESVQVKLQQLMLGLEEVQKSGKPAQDDLTSPLVGGRDFVGDRLTLQMRIASLAAEGEATTLANAQRRFDVGLMTQQELADVQAANGRAAAELRLLQQELDLRRRFLAGSLKAKDVSRERAMAVARSEIQAAELSLQAATKRYEFVQRQFKVGLATEVERLKAQVAVLEQEKDLKVLRAQLQMLESGGGQ